MLRLGVFLCLSLAACATTQPRPAASAPASSSLPDFELPTIDGDQVRLSDYLGKSVVVLSFWDTWCTPCAAELPHMDALYQKYKGQGLVVLAIAMDAPTTVAQVAPLVRRNGYTFPVLLDEDTRVASVYNKQKNAPYTVVIDRSGHIASEQAGYEPGAEKVLEAEVARLLGEPKKAP